MLESRTPRGDPAGVRKRFQKGKPMSDDDVCQYCGGEADIHVTQTMTLVTERARRKINPGLGQTIRACLECCSRLGPAFIEATEKLVGDGLSQ
jgi:hypothetical protein